MAAAEINTEDLQRVFDRYKVTDGSDKGGVSLWVYNA